MLQSTSVIVLRLSPVDGLPLGENVVKTLLGATVRSPTGYGPTAPPTGANRTAL